VAVSDTLIGTLFDGRYQVERKLGAGGMANVYLAEDQELGRRVAIKILNDRHAGDEQFVERFRREAKNAAALSHPNIVSIYDRGEAEGTYYIAMEYLDGRSLKELIVQRGPAPITVSVEYARQILSALRFAHRHGIVHRDIKPHNVLVDADGRVKVTDFGIARIESSMLTQVGAIMGTPGFIAPEMYLSDTFDNRVDLFAAGVVLYGAALAIFVAWLNRLARDSGKWVSFPVAIYASLFLMLALRGSLMIVFAYATGAVLAFLLASACLSIGRRPIGQRYYRRNVHSRSPENESMPTFGVSSLHHQSKG